MQYDLQISDVKLMDVNVLYNRKTLKRGIINKNANEISILIHPMLSLYTRTKVMCRKSIEHSRDALNMTIITNSLLLLINSQGN